ncbi:MAG: hypothetical protein R3B96_17935 [Pirellulaceae bacterium]
MEWEEDGVTLGVSFAFASSIQGNRRLAGIYGFRDRPKTRGCRACW